MKTASLALLLAAGPMLLQGQNAANWDALDQQVEQLYLKGDLAGALNAAKLALDAASNPKQTGRSLDRLGFLYYNSGNLKDGETFLRQGLDLRREKLGADSDDYAQSANDLALFLRDTRRFPEAQALAEEAAAVRSRILDANDPSLAETLETLGSIYTGEGEYDKSAATFEKARAIYESRIDAKNPAPPEYGTLLVNLSGNYSAVGAIPQVRERTTRPRSMCWEKRSARRIPSIPPARSASLISRRRLATIRPPKNCTTKRRLFEERLGRNASHVHPVVG
jgi:tetratricopeptide (TPR) repeat protein